MWKSIVTAALLAQYVDAQAMLRFACSQLVVERTDPIVNPGMIFTPHLHQIVGGNSFNITMDPATHNLAEQSTCTSCSFVEDLSNYWTAVMFFRNNKGQYQRVPQIGNGGPQGKLINDGGMDIYYIPGNRGKLTAFQPGFRMVAGDAGETDASKVARGALCHRCWNQPSENTFVGGAPCSGRDTVEIPNDKSCLLIRQTIIFATCWDGKNLDSPDHQSHVSYGGRYGATGGGNCPASHPVKIPQVMYEVMWNTTEFARSNDWPTDGGPAYVLSMDLGGSAVHGDYVFGWKDDSLQLAMDRGCNLNRDCPEAGLHYQAPEKYNACKIPQSAPEKVDGWLEALPLGPGIMKE